MPQLQEAWNSRVLEKWFFLVAFLTLCRFSQYADRKGPAGVEDVTRLTVVPLRSSLVQGNDKNLGPLSTPRLDSDPDYRKKQSDIGQHFHLEP
jgi:hypothetical protein